jgi:hypothetical protein
LKITCSLMALLFVIAILNSNKVESRIIHQVRSFFLLKKIILYMILKNFEGIPALQFHHHAGDGQINAENHNVFDQDEFEHVKRKSDFLLSLYGLPYTLVNRRDSD